MRRNHCLSHSVRCRRSGAEASTIVTSNLDFPEWDQAFPNNRLLASATLDRLRHNA
ncbi:ATP-binding protein [Tepidimonas thermarum]|uniref:ATP-binding protein n=1 Tax=Tepidimonas thermarum TaxID=335431 RepID=UPI003CCC6D36